jgi:glyoxylase-like metal-dependent hydrolase (beta-lactamase superfamily II)
VSVVDAGLGHSGHVVAVDGEVLVVDPVRAVGRYLRVIDDRGWRLRWVADTHTHADYVSGGPILAAEGHAAFLASRRAHLLADHRPLDAGDELQVAGLTMRALATPGHTPDHLAFLLVDGHRPVAVFTGGSLMVGAVGRTDLVGPAHTEALARAMFQSLHDQLLALPDDVAVYPTHGAGSFCSARASNDRTSTIGREKATNPMLQITDEDEFVRRLVGGVGSLPDHFAWLPEVNRQGVGPILGPPLPRLSAREVRHMAAAEAVVVDTRPVAAFAAGHVPGSVSIALRPGFASWLAWLVPPGPLVVFVTDEDADDGDLIEQCSIVGHDRLAGRLQGGIAAWADAGLAVASIPVVTAGDVGGAVLDVRRADEYESGHVPGARHVELGRLYAIADGLAGPLDVMCGHGERAATAASLLARRGVAGLRVVVGGPREWAASGRCRLAVGP